MIFGQMQHRTERQWSEFYNHLHTAIPSSFAASVALEWTEPPRLIDLGCGNARGSFFFAHPGHSVLGLDIADSKQQLVRSDAYIS